MLDKLVAVTPLSGWTAVSAALGLLAAVALWRPLVRISGWRSRTTLLALLVLAAVLALTLSRGDITERPLGVRSCLRAASGQLDGGLLGVLGSAEALLNLVLLVPLGALLVLASRGVLVAVAVVLVLPGVVEIGQTQVSGRLCSGVDYVTNVAGGLAGALLGVTLLGAGRLLRRG